MPQADEFRVFLSAVSSEFETARNEIANDFDARNIRVKVQRNFRQERGADTVLRLLHDYIASCTAVVCVIGKRSGAFPTRAEVEPFAHMLPPGLAEASYTQWEFIFARHHHRRLSVYVARDDCEPDRSPASYDRPDLQEAFLAYVRSLGRLYTEFSDTHELCRWVSREDWPTRVGRKPKNLPFATLGPLFKGREKFLDDLHAALVGAGEGKAAAVTGKAVHGLGGVGKTRVAIEYAWRHAWEYSALLFVSAETPERLSAGLAALVGTDILDLPEKDEREDAEKISATLRWLENHPTWLMILDNVDDRKAAEAVEQLLPRLAGGRVLMTARNTNFVAAVETLELGVLGTDDATEFLLERTRGKRRESANDAALARDLATELGGLALGLEQAGAYISTQRIPLERYLDLWKENRAKVLGWFDRSLTAYNHDVGLAATWATSVGQLTPAGRRLLERLAFFAPEPIPESLLDAALPGEDADFDAHEALADLDAYSLVSRSKAEDGAKEPTFSVHRLVQDFTRRGLEEAKRRDVLQEALAWVDAAFTGDPQDVRNWPVLDALASHALALAQHDNAGIADPTRRLYSQLGLLYHVKARHAEAEPLMRRALAIAEKSYGPDHPHVAIHLANLAQLLQATNRLAEAEPLMRRSLVITEASYGPDHPKVAIHLNNLAALLQATNRRAEAEPSMRRSLVITEASYGPDHPDVARDLNNLAQLLQATNRLAEAEPLMRRALAIDEKCYGPDHPNVATVLNNLAQLLQATNRLAEAEPLMCRALAIDEASYGPDHPNVATVLNNLALLLKATNRLAEPEPLYRRALAIAEKSYGPDHPNVAISLNNLARLLQDTNRHAEAEPLYRRALAIDEASYGPDHPNVAIRLNNLGRLLQATNRLAEAEPLMRRALAIDEASYGPDHPNVARDLDNLGRLLQATNRLTEAEPLMRRALAIDEKSYGPDHPDVARDLNNLAVLLQATNRLAEAEPMVRRALVITEKSYGPDPPNVATALNNLAVLLKDTNRLAEAEPLMRRSLVIDEKSYGPDHPDVARDLNNLAQLLQATNRLAEADPLMRRHVEIFLLFTAQTGHPHPHLLDAFENYHNLLVARGRSGDEARAQ